MVTIPKTGAGIAGGEYTEDYKHVALLTDDFPAMTTAEVVADAVVSGADLPAYSVVGRDSSGKIVMAVLGGGSPIAPIGITCHAVNQGATAKNVTVYRSGCFNPDALNWGSSYDTDAKKRVAFEASQPTIFIKKPKFSV